MAEVIRYLPDEEKNRTRALWERIFVEDSERFLDYYYHIKTADNEILVLERDGEILSMLQLNPYRLQLGAAQVEAAYVIAVATDSRYRHHLPAIWILVYLPATEHNGGAGSAG